MISPASLVFPPSRGERIKPDIQSTSYGPQRLGPGLLLPSLNPRQRSATDVRSRGQLRSRQTLLFPNDADLSADI